MKKIIIIILVLLVAGIFLLGVSLNGIIKKSVETVGTEATGAAVRLADVDISILSGKGNLKGLFIGNPEGFKTESAFSLGEVRLAMNISSLMSDRIIIDEVFINSPDITYEKSSGRDNINAILNNVKRFAGISEKGEEGKEEKKAGEEKKVQINTLTVKNGRINMSVTGLQGKTVTLSLPDIEMKDIGKDGDGTSFSEAMEQVLAAVNSNVVTAAAGSVGDIRETVEKAVGEKIDETAGETIGKEVDKLKGIFGK